MVKPTSREIVISIIRGTIGFLYVLAGKPYLNRGLTAFVFHEVNNDPNYHARQTHTFTGVELFERQIKWIKSAFSIVDLQDPLVELPEKGGIVSFDDGYRGVLLNALPILERYSVPAICFLNMATIQGEINSSALAMYLANEKGEKVDWRDSNPRFFARSIATLSMLEIEKVRAYQGPYMSEDEIEILSRNRWITIGDHLHNHWYMDSLSVKELNEEVAQGQVGLQRFSWDKRFFASPHGVASEVALNCLEDGGYTFIFSSMTTRDSDVYPRVDMNDTIRNRYQFFGAILTSRMRNAYSVFK